MAVRTYPPIAREGWLILLVAAIAAAAAYLALGLAWSAPLWLLVAAAAFLFRDPPRLVPSAPLGVLSPADGYVVSIEEVHDEYIDRPALRLTIDMRWSGVFSLRSPVEGKLVKHWRGAPGERSDAGDRTRALWVQTDEADDVVTVMRPSRWSVRSACYYQSGERIGQGRRCGFLLLGSRIDLLLPRGARVLVKPGERVLSGSSVVAQFIHRSGS